MVLIGLDSQNLAKIPDFHYKYRSTKKIDTIQVAYFSHFWINFASILVPLLLSGTTFWPSDGRLRHPFAQLGHVNAPFEAKSEEFGVPMPLQGCFGVEFEAILDQIYIKFIIIVKFKIIFLVTIMFWVNDTLTQTRNNLHTALSLHFDTNSLIHTIFFSPTSADRSACMIFDFRFLKKKLKFWLW